MSAKRPGRIETRMSEVDLASIRPGYGVLPGRRLKGFIQDGFNLGDTLWSSKLRIIKISVVENERYAELLAQRGKIKKVEGLREVSQRAAAVVHPTRLSRDMTDAVRFQKEIEEITVCFTITCDEKQREIGFTFSDETNTCFDLPIMEHFLYTKTRIDNLVFMLTPNQEPNAVALAQEFDRIRQELQSLEEGIQKIVSLHRINQGVENNMEMAQENVDIVEGSMAIDPEIMGMECEMDLAHDPMILPQNDTNMALDNTLTKF